MFSNNRKITNLVRKRDSFEAAFHSSILFSIKATVILMPNISAVGNSFLVGCKIKTVHYNLFLKVYKSRKAVIFSHKNILCLPMDVPHPYTSLVGIICKLEVFFHKQFQPWQGVFIIKGVNQFIAHHLIPGDPCASKCKTYCTVFIIQWAVPL